MNLTKHALVVGLDPAVRKQLSGRDNFNESSIKLHFVNSGLEALVALAATQCNAILVSGRLTGMKGELLLDEVMRRHPKVLRFLIVDARDQQATLRSLGTAHHVLRNVSGVAMVQSAIERADSLEAWLPREGVCRLLPRLTNLPSPPAAYFEVVRQLESPESSLEDIGRSISRDPAMTAKLLQLVNSAMFGLRLTVSHPGEAVAYLGVETTKSLILLAHTFSHFAKLATPGFSINDLWSHSYRVARSAEMIAQAECGDRELTAAAFTGGLLHDIGKLILAANMPDEFTRIVFRAGSEQTPLWQAESNVLGIHHADIGACMLATWDLPVQIIEAVGLHHHPARISAEGFTPLTAVHVANCLCQSKPKDGFQPLPARLDLEYLQATGVCERINTWKLAWDADPVLAGAPG